MASFLYLWFKNCFSCHFAPRWKKNGLQKCGFLILPAEPDSTQALSRGLQLGIGVTNSEEADPILSGATYMKSTQTQIQRCYLPIFKDTVNKGLVAANHSDSLKEIQRVEVSKIILHSIFPNFSVLLAYCLGNRFVFAFFPARRDTQLGKNLNAAAAPPAISVQYLFNQESQVNPSFPNTIIIEHFTHYTHSRTGHENT